MSTYNTVAKLLIDTLYNLHNTTKCGPKHEFTAYHSKVRMIQGLTGSADQIPMIVPDSAYHPQIVVGFDFTHKFTSDATTATGIETSRPVTKETLLRVGQELKRFFLYYFEYAMSYGKQGRGGFPKAKSQLRQLLDYPGYIDEQDMNLFINSVLNFFLSTVSVDQIVNEIGVCNISYTNNLTFKHGVKSSLLVDRTFGILSQLFAPMVPVMVWAKGRLYKDWYFPLFDGYITSIDMGGNSGFGTVTINARDSLELARISTEMVNPSIIQFKELITQENINIFSMPFFGIDHLAIFKTMFNGGKLIYDPEKQRLKIGHPEFQKTTALNFAALGNFEETTDENDNIATIYDDYAVHKDKFSLQWALSQTSHNRARHTITWGNSITPYRSTTVNQAQTFTGEFSSRLEIVRNIADLVYYNFYVDGKGHVNYHPMRLANKFLTADAITLEDIFNDFHIDPFPGAQVIGPEETFSATSRVNIEELKTFLRVEGQPSWLGSTPEPALLGLVGSAVDEGLMAKFGYRRGSVKNPLLSVDARLPGKNGEPYYFINLVAKALLHHMNAEFYTTQRNIAFRPELRIARPILFPYDKEVFYCQSLSHSITINGEATTSVNGNFGRKEAELPPDLLSFMIISEKLFKINQTTFQETVNDLLGPQSTDKERTTFYQNHFGLSEIPFQQYVEDVAKQRKLFEEAEKQKSKERASTPKEDLDAMFELQPDEDFD